MPTLFGKGSLKIPAGTASGTTFRLREKGMPSLRGGRQGDQLVRVQVEVPTSLSSDQRKLLEEFARPDSRQRTAQMARLPRFKDTTWPTHFGRFENFLDTLT